MEIWKDVPGYNGQYQVSNEGRVRSWWFRNKPGRKPRILKANIGANGYYVLGLHHAGSKKNHYVHLLVAHVFLGHEPKNNLIVVDHINNIPTDNRLENLQVVTQRINRTKEMLDKGLPIGVTKNTNGKKFSSKIRHKGKSLHLGSFNTPEEAHEAYLNKLKELEQNG